MLGLTSIFLEIFCPAYFEMPEVVHVCKGSEVGPAWVYVLLRTVAKSGDVCDAAHGNPSEEGA